MMYGYARVSSNEQKLDRQLIELERYGIIKKNIYYDKLSGANFDRTNYQKLKKN